MDFEKIKEECWEIAEEHGWHEKKRSVGEMIALCHSELSEALEEHREPMGKLKGYSVPGLITNEQANTRLDCAHNNELDGFYIHPSNNKPEGILIELADTVIRIMEWAHDEGWDLEHAITLKNEYNTKREYRHGGKAL